MPGDTKELDIFLRDRQYGTTERVSETVAGTQANGESNLAAISADGRFVAFQSRASNLVSGDLNGVQDIFIRAITPPNTAPGISLGPYATVAEGAPYTGSGAFIDPDADTWTAAVSYGDGSGVQPLTLNPDKSFTLSHTYAENGSYIVTVTVTDGDGSTSPAAVTEAGGSGTASAIHTYAAPGAYTVTLTVTDDDGDSGTTTLPSVVIDNPAPVVSGGPDAAVDEAAPYTGSGSFTDQPGDAWSATVDYGDGSGVQPLPLNADKSFALNHTYADNGSYTVTVTVSDSYGAAGTDTLTVTVGNVSPNVGAITAPADPVAVGVPVTISAPFTDPGNLDTHTALVDWGDGSTSPAGVTEAGGSGTAGATHTYATAGIYTVTLTVTDKDGGSGTALFQYVVIYDPEGGFVTGVGRIQSPAGAFAADPALTGKASFRFTLKYQKGATAPSGQAQFQFKGANLNFQSQTYQWMVISGAWVQFKGTGVINGAGDYAFLITAVDGQVSGGGADRFRIKIWDRVTGAVVYDCQPGAVQTGEPSTAIDSGSIVIH